MRRREGLTLHQKMGDALFRKFVQFINFSFIGICTFSVGMFLTLLLTEKGGIVYYLSYAAGLAISWMLNFFLNLRLTFMAHGRVSLMFEKYIMFAIALLAVNWFLVFICVELIGLLYFIAIPLVTMLLSAAGFLIESKWVYAKKEMIKKVKSGH